MTSKKKYIAIMFAIVGVLLAIYSQTDKLKAETPKITPFALTNTPWIDGYAQGGMLRYGLTEGTTQPADGPAGALVNAVPNVEYMKDKDTNIRHIFDNSTYKLASTPPFNIIETDEEYQSGWVYRHDGGVASFTSVTPVLDKITATGKKLSDPDLQIAIEMKANDRNSAVMHNYTITNNSNVNKTIYPFKEVDTMLDGDDNVPVLSRGPNKGVYIESAEDLNNPSKARYRLDYAIDFKNNDPEVHAPLYYRSAFQGSPFNRIFGNDKDAQGAHPAVISNMAAPENEIIYADGVNMLPGDPRADTGIYMSWGKVELAPGESYKMRYDVGIRPLDSLIKTKTVENLTSTDGKNRVGDEVEYSITIESPKYSYTNLQIEDVLPSAFEHPTDVVTVTDVAETNGNPTSFPISEVYDETTRTLLIPKDPVNGLKIKALGKIELKFKVKLTKSSAGMEVTNLATVTGLTEFQTKIEEEVETEKPLKVEDAGRVIVKFQDESGKDISTSATIEDIIGTDYDANSELKVINGYTYKEATGPVVGKITQVDQEVIFIYSENRFTILQEGEKADGSNAHNAAVDMGDVLTYKTTVTSQLVAGATPVYYNDFTIVADVSPNLKDVNIISFESSTGTPITDFIFDSVTNKITAKVASADLITSDEDLILTYEGTVKDVSDTTVEAQSTASGGYSDGMVAAAIASNKVISNRGAGNLEFTAPTMWDFGTRKISDKKEEYSLAKLDTHIVVTDNRAVGSKWKLSAKLTKDFTLSSSTNVLPDILNYREGNTITPLPLNTETALISQETTAATRGQGINVTKDWVDKKEGLVLVVPGNIVKKGTYEADITWTVTDAP